MHSEAVLEDFPGPMIGPDDQRVFGIVLTNEKKKKLFVVGDENRPWRRPQWPASSQNLQRYIRRKQLAASQAHAGRKKIV